MPAVDGTGTAGSSPREMPHHSMAETGLQVIESIDADPRAAGSRDGETF